MYFQSCDTLVLLSFIIIHLPVLPTLHHITAQKTASVTGKKFNSPSVCDENKSLRPSALRTKTSVNFPLENSLRLHQWGSQTASSLLMMIM